MLIFHRIRLYKFYWTFVWILLPPHMFNVAGHSPAKIVQSLQETRAIAGESILFACQAEGNPSPRLVFRWNEKELTQSQSGFQLRITSPESLSLRAKLDANHNGDVVSCMAQNQMGSDVSSARITVFSANETPPRGFPKVIQDPSATISQIGSSAQIQCEVNAEPPATVSWIKDHFNLVDLTQSRYRIVGTGSLVIENLEESDSGSYECMARNTVGTVLSNSGHLHVRHNLTIIYHFLQKQGIQFPPSIHEMPDWVNVAPGQRANLTCRAGGFPIPMVWWSTAGNPVGPQSLAQAGLTERPLTEPEPYEATLRLTDIAESQNYYCMAKNALGLVRRNVSVAVTELPLAPVELDVRPIGGTYAVVWWSRSPSSGVDSYTLMLETEGQQQQLGNLATRQLANLQPKLSPNPSNPGKMFYHYNLTNLIPYTHYVVRVHAMSRTAGLSLPSDAAKFRTAELAPGTSPQGLYATVVSPDSVMISWKPPLEPNGRINGYKVYHTTRPEDPLSSWLVTRASEEQIILSNLIPNATYYTKVSAYTTAGDGPTTQVLPLLVTPGVPSAPSKFRGQVLDATTVQLTWEPPLVSSGVKLKGYQLRYRSSAGNEFENPALEDVSTKTIQLPPQISEFTLKNLKPSTTYHISLVGETQNGFGVGAQIEVKTNDQNFRLNKPSGVHLQSIATDSAELCWEKPSITQNKNATIIFELLFDFAEEANDIDSATGVIEVPFEHCCCFKMSNLLAGKDYRVWLRFVWIDNGVDERPLIGNAPRRKVGPTSEPQAFRTSLAVPGLPQGRKILVLGATTIQVTWNGPRERQSDVRHYQLTWTCVECNIENENDRIFHGGDYTKVGQRKVLATEDAMDNRLYTATISDLIPDMSYQVSVSAVNARGTGKAYTYPLVRTLKQVPLRPKNLHLVSIHKRPRPQPPMPEISGYHVTQDTSYLSIELAWDPPDELRTSQQITYQVFVRIIGPEDLVAELSVQDDTTGNYEKHFGEQPLSDPVARFPSQPHPLLSRRLLANVTGNTFRSSESDNIAYGVSYQFEVTLFNGSLSGPSVKLNVTTPDAAPLTSPLHVRLSGLSANAVEVSWSPPPFQYRNGRIVAYQLRYFEVGAEAKTETLVKLTTPGQRQYTAKNLKEKTYYTFMVRAFTSAGHGPWSGASNIRTSVELPPPPVDIRATRINQHQIKVTWAIPEGQDSGSGSRAIPIQGFRLLYSPNNNPYEAGQWTSFDVGPVSMAIISHLDSKSSYVICIKSRGQDGRYGDCSQPVIGRTAAVGTEPDFSVRNLLCTGDEASVKVTWQQPLRTKKLEGFKLRVGGSKKFADATGVIRSVEFPARSVSVAYAAVHSGYTYTVSDLEANSIYDVQVTAYYDMSLSMESNWETTSCYTQMQRPSYVIPPIPVAVSPMRRQILLQLSRISERFGKIRHYFLVVAPIHLTSVETEKVDIENTITTSRGLPSSGTRYVAAKYQQDYFDPPPRTARNFTLGGLVSRRRRSVDKNQLQNSEQQFNAAMDAEISFDNKVLVDGQEYKAFVRACVYQADHSNPSGPDVCTSSEWSAGFGPDREIPPKNPMLVKAMQDYVEEDGLMVGVSADDSNKLQKNILGYTLAGNDLFIVAAAAVIVGLALIAVICIVFGCMMRRRRSPKLQNHVNSTGDPALKQPLIHLNDCGFVKDSKNIMHSSGIDLLPANINPLSSIRLAPDQRSMLTIGRGSQIIPSSPSMIPHGSLLNSITTVGARSAMANSGTPSPVTGISHLDFSNQQVTQGHRFHLSSPQFAHLYCESGNVVHNLQSSVNSFNTGRVMESMGSHAGSNPSSILGGAHSGLINGSNVNSEHCGDESFTTGGPDFIISTLSYGNKGSFMRQPIPINCLADHISRLSAADNLLFAQEYESIETDRQFTWEHSNMEVNKPKNRYANVIAYDHSRVILQFIDGVPGSEYINANYIDGYKKPNAYIATQGPMPDTYSDFWRMIWEQRVCIIVMMTRLEERSRVKCDQYWPSRSSETYAGGLLTVTLIETVELAYYTIRTFNIVARGIDDECREVRHFQFTGWPDHGVPEYPIPLLLFIRRVRATVGSNNVMVNGNGSTNPVEQGPIVVHCSAGVGRTGAYIVVDMMLERIRYEKTVDIYGCVKSLRAQRNFMVQTEEQYVFVHAALLEAIDAGNTEIPARNLLAHVRKLRMLDVTGGSGMELEFKQLQQFRLSRAKYTSAQLLCNRGKNRFPNALPYESTRVVLQPIRGVEGSDYVNASFIDSYRSRRAYVATQGPLAKTVEDFWRMIWEYNSTIVVMLSKFVERGQESCYPYWPSERSARYQYYVVDPVVEYNMPNYTLREFKLTDARDGQSRTLRQFQFTEWPEQGVPNSCEAFIEFLGQVHKTKEQFGQDGPITVHCSNGVGRTGVFLALSIVLDRMRSEGIVDLFQTVRMLRTQRYGLVENEDEYRFCYSAALEYLSSFDHYVST